MRDYEFTIKGKMKALDRDAAMDMAMILAERVADDPNVDSDSLVWDAVVMPRDHLDPPASVAVDTVEAEGQEVHSGPIVGDPYPTDDVGPPAPGEGDDLPNPEPGMRC